MDSVYDIGFSIASPQMLSAGCTATKAKCNVEPRRRKNMRSLSKAFSNGE